MAGHHIFYIQESMGSGNNMVSKRSLALNSKAEGRLTDIRYLAFQAELTGCWAGYVKQPIDLNFRFLKPFTKNMTKTR